MLVNDIRPFDRMMNFTPIARPYFSHVAREMLACAGAFEQSQRQLLKQLLKSARSTMWGESHGFASIDSYEQFAATQPLVHYEDIRDLVMKMVAGERDLLWHGRVSRFAQSSGTSDGKSKYIPITADGLKRCHYRGSTDVVANYLRLYPDSRIFSGNAFILGGSFATELHPTSGVKVGDLSAHLIECINPIANLVRVPDKKTALMIDWNKKLPALVNAAVKADVTNISGVPSWFLTVLKEILKATGASSIHDIWGNLEVFFHGGISFEPYREQYRHITDTSRMRYLETYNASEGFFAVQLDRDSRAMLLLADVGVLYEFIPVTDADSDNPEVIPAWKAVPGKIYEMVITSCNGLWRYRLGDTVKVESVEPLTITIAGRTKHFINAFGEELMVHNADAALSRTCRETGASIKNYTAAPVYAGDRSRGRHEWLIEWAHRPADTAEFASQLDANLRRENSDYDAKRSGNIFLDPLTIVEARHGLFDRWLASTGKLGGQRKVPRLCNDRRFLDPLLELNDSF